MSEDTNAKIQADHDRPPGRGAPRDVPVSMDQTYGQQVGQEHRGERVPDPVQGSEPENQDLRRGPKKSFCSAGPFGRPEAIQAGPATTKRLERFDEEAAAQTFSGGAAAVNITPA
ncbi:hypothetical protein AYI70_g10473, partial [Smittium culicis]